MITNIESYSQFRLSTNSTAAGVGHTLFAGLHAADAAVNAVNKNITFAVLDGVVAVLSGFYAVQSFRATPTEKKIKEQVDKMKSLSNRIKSAQKAGEKINKSDIEKIASAIKSARSLAKKMPFGMRKAKANEVNRIIKKSDSLFREYQIEQIPELTKEEIEGK